MQKLKNLWCKILCLRWWAIWWINTCWKKKKNLLNARFVGHLILPLHRQMSSTRKMINKKEMIMLYISSCSHWIGRWFLLDGSPLQGQYKHFAYTAVLQYLEKSSMIAEEAIPSPHQCSEVSRFKNYSDD